MKQALFNLVAFAGALVVSPVAVSAQSGSLPGVMDEETVIHSGQIEEFHRGKGDVLFVRDRTNKWFRLRTNDGCLSGPGSFSRLVVEKTTPDGPIDRFTRIVFTDGIARSCRIDSIRRSEAPPQVDSDSPVTLD